MSVFFSMVLAGLALGLGNLATAIGLANQVGKARRGPHILMWQALMQSLFPILGFVWAGSVLPVVGIGARFGLSGLLVLGGLSQVVLARALSAPHSPGRAQFPAARVAELTAITAARNLVIGAVLRLLSTPLILTGAIIGTAGILVSLAGVELWRGLGRRAEVGINLGAGIVLIVLAFVFWLTVSGGAAGSLNCLRPCS